MSSLYCEHCGALCSDAAHGYVTGCEHYLLDVSCSARPDDGDELIRERDEARAEVERLRPDAERFIALFQYLNTHQESPWGVLEDSEYSGRLDAGEPIIAVVRDAIDKHLRRNSDER
jgi:hypothetical protein